MTNSESRLGRLRAALEQQQLDALIVTNSSNIRYLSGFTGSNGRIVVTATSATLVTDSRYTERAHDELASADASVGGEVQVEVAPGPGHDALQRLLTKSNAIGLEADDQSWSQVSALQALFGAERIHATTGLVEALRELKNEAEIELMAQAAAIADHALGQVIASGVAGRSERELQRLLDHAALSFGADGPSFDTIVASGPNASRPHHEAGDRVIEVGDLLIVDFGAEVGGYRSDMTRSFVIGEPTDQQRLMLDAVAQAQAAGVDRTAVGVSAADIDDACREVLRAHDLGEYFVHGTGHGVGLDIHEAPSVSSTSTATLSAGHVITVEPGVYIPGIGGVRWEDTVVITDHGTRTLTQSPKQPLLDA